MSEDDLFRREVADAVPLSAEERAAPPPRAAPGVRQATDEEAETAAALADLVAGRAPFELFDTGEYSEGIAQGIDRRLLTRLKRGDYSVQAHADLHGLTATQARAQVAAFVAESRREGRRCVLFVHGRGLRSKDHVPVLKERLKTWLSRGSIGRQVLAFCTARPADGGAGAMYVLLRR
jgi:DNA-nicking Smr family endonuclease